MNNNTSIYEASSGKIKPGADYTLYLLKCNACRKYKRVLANPPIGPGGTLSCPICKHYNLNGPGLEGSFGSVKVRSFKIKLPRGFE